MKENSREEDMKILEKLINTMKSDRELFDEKIDKEIYAFFINALEHILQDYKRVLKENEELKLYNNSITSQLEQMTTEKFKNGWFHQSEFKDSIPVQKVKDKIEELKINLVNMQGEELLIYESKIDVLQELLEGRK